MKILIALLSIIALASSALSSPAIAGLVNPSSMNSLGIAHSLLQYPGSSYRAAYIPMIGQVTSIFSNGWAIVESVDGSKVLIPREHLQQQDSQLAEHVPELSARFSSQEMPATEADESFGDETTLMQAMGQYMSLKLKAFTASMQACISCLSDKIIKHTNTLEDSFAPVEKEIARTLAATESIGEAILLGVSTEEIKQLIEQGANIERRDSNGKTALMLAALLGKWQEMALLIDAQAELNAQDDEGNTALHFALDVGHHEAAALLISRGANVSKENNAGIAPLQMAQEKEDKVLLELVQIHPQARNPAPQDTAHRLLQRAAAQDNQATTQTEEVLVEDDK